jgi:hypothetical protein
MTGQGSSHNASTGGASSGSISQGSTPCGGSSPMQFAMAGHDPTIRLPNLGVRQQKTLKSTCLFVQISGKKNRSQMRTQSWRS